MADRIPVLEEMARAIADARVEPGNNEWPWDFSPEAEKRLHREAARAAAAVLARRLREALGNPTEAGQCAYRVGALLAELEAKGEGERGG